MSNVVHLFRIFVMQVSCICLHFHDTQDKSEISGYDSLLFGTMMNNFKPNSTDLISTSKMCS